MAAKGRVGIVGLVVVLGMSAAWAEEPLVATLAADWVPVATDGSYDANAHVADNGIDAWGRFHSDPDREAAPDAIRVLLSDIDFAEQVLAAGEVTAVASLEDEHTVLRSTLALDPEHATLLGVDTLEVCFKPEADNWYGREYRRELAYYHVASWLGAQGLVPMVERDVALAPIVDQLTAELTEEQAAVMPLDTTALHGSVQLWVAGYSDVVGTRSTGTAWTDELAATLGDPEVLGYADPMWQALSDLFVLDYALGNTDRHHEFGTITYPDGHQRLIMLDHGDALQGVGGDPLEDHWVSHFQSVTHYSPNLVDGLRALDEDMLRALWTGTDGRLLARDRRVQQTLDRIADALAIIDATIAENSDAGLFAETSVAFAE